MIGKPYDWCAGLANASDDVLGAALAEALRQRPTPGVRGVRFRRERWLDGEGRPFHGDLERWTLHVAVIFDDPDVASDPRMVEQTHWQLARSLHATVERYTGVCPNLERFGVADPKLREYRAPSPGVTLPLPPPRPSSVTVGGPRATAQEPAQEPAQARAEPPRAPAPPPAPAAAPSGQGSLF